MPPPNYKCRTSSPRSSGDHERETPKYESVSETSSDDELRKKSNQDSISIVKSILGPSLEEAILRTLEFGKSLIQKPDAPVDLQKSIKQKVQKLQGKEVSYAEEFIYDEEISPRNIPKNEEDQEIKTSRAKRCSKKRIVFTANIDKEISFFAKEQSNKKVKKVSKIRSLDSDLKQLTPSPEKIKRQLEALIQINKDEPPECARPWPFQKAPVDFTVMPLCMYPNENQFNCSSTCKPSDEVKIEDSNCNYRGSAYDSSFGSSNFQSNGQSNFQSNGQSNFQPNGQSNFQSNGQSNFQSNGQSNVQYQNERSQKTKFGKLRQAPGLLSSALGPTIDVSIIDNLNIMRDLLKCEPKPTPEENPCPCPCPDDCLLDPPVCDRPLESELLKDPSSDQNPCRGEPQSGQTVRFEELQKRICELEKKEKCLLKQIELDELERATRRKAFEEEEKKRCTGIQTARINPPGEVKFDLNFRQKLFNEEEKLAKLKNQCDLYQKELCEAREKKDCLKRNKSLLDAWDVIASRVCHTKLPPFSRLCTLERRSTKSTPGDIHCCLINPQGRNYSVPPPGVNLCAPQGCGPVSDCTMPPRLDYRDSCSKSSKYKKQMDAPYPLQRDITCGLHQTLKLCICGGDVIRRLPENLGMSTDDELAKKFGKKDDKISVDKYMQKSMEKFMDRSGDPPSEKPPDKIKPMERCLGRNMDKDSATKHLNRSRSDTAVRKDKNSRILKVMWAVTRINIFQDNIRTYEVMDATTIPPPCTPAKTEGIFVVKNCRKKPPNSPRRSCQDRAGS